METNMEVKVDKRTNAYKDSIKNQAVEPTPQEVADTMEAIEQSDPPVVYPPPKPKPDLLHCPRCGVELLEDERNGKSVAYCRACIWRNA